MDYRQIGGRKWDGDISHTCSECAAGIFGSAIFVSAPKIYVKRYKAEKAKAAKEKANIIQAIKDGVPAP